MAVETINFDSFNRLANSLGELEVIIGPAARPAIAEVKDRLIDAAVRYKSGDAPGAYALIRAAMQSLAALAVNLDPAEAALMRIISERFSTALTIGDKDAAKTAINVMRHKAGDPKDDPNTDW